MNCRYAANLELLYVSHFKLSFDVAPALAVVQFTLGTEGICFGVDRWTLSPPMANRVARNAGVSNYMVIPSDEVDARSTTFPNWSIQHLVLSG